MGNVIVVGSGGREHALAEKLKRDDGVDTVFCCPGNGGTAISDGLKNLNYRGFPELAEKAKKNGVELVVIGPEGPLAEGASDYLRGEGLQVFGFRREAAKLEASKAYADRFKRKYGVSSPSFEIFDELFSAQEFLREKLSRGNKKFWIKADELCGGKGAISVSTPREAEETLRLLMVEKKCGRGERVIVQEHLEGEEVTVQSFTDGRDFLLLPPSQDHKSVYAGGKGPNTGGMGAYCPTPAFNQEVRDRFLGEVLNPTREGFEGESLDTSGLLYFGLMLEEGEDPRLLEYNVRFGDPEAQPVLSLLETDLSLVLRASNQGRLNEVKKDVSWKDGASVCVVLATEGYPVDYGEERLPIEGLEDAEGTENVRVYHAGTVVGNGRIYTDGGRILAVTATEESIEKARDLAYRAVRRIHFDGMHYREDIAADL